MWSVSTTYQRAGERLAMLRKLTLSYWCWWELLRKYSLRGWHWCLAAWGMWRCCDTMRRWRELPSKPRARCPRSSDWTCRGWGYRLRRWQKWCGSDGYWLDRGLLRFSGDSESWIRLLLSYGPGSLRPVTFLATEGPHRRWCSRHRGASFPPSYGMSSRDCSCGGLRQCLRRFYIRQLDDHTPRSPRDPRGRRRRNRRITVSFYKPKGHQHPL